MAALDIPVSLDRLADVRRFVTMQADLAGLNEGQVDRLELAVVEGLVPAGSRLGGRSLLEDNIRAVGINPGPVETDRMVTLLKGQAQAKWGDDSRWRELTASMPQGRGAKPREIGTGHLCELLQRLDALLADPGATSALTDLLRDAVPEYRPDACQGDDPYPADLKPD